MALRATLRTVQHSKDKKKKPHEEQIVQAPATRASAANGWLRRTHLDSAARQQQPGGRRAEKREKAKRREKQKTATAAETPQPRRAPAAERSNKKTANEEGEERDLRGGTQTKTAIFSPSRRARTAPPRQCRRPGPTRAAAAKVNLQQLSAAADAADQTAEEDETGARSDKPARRRE